MPLELGCGSGVAVVTALAVADEILEGNKGGIWIIIFNDSLIVQNNPLIRLKAINILMKVLKAVLNVRLVLLFVLFHVIISFIQAQNNQGPDGERLRLKSAELYDEALKYCTNCKRCEVACPSDVKIGDLIVRARNNHLAQSKKNR